MKNIDEVIRQVEELNHQILNLRGVFTHDQIAQLKDEVITLLEQSIALQFNTEASAADVLNERTSEENGATIQETRDEESEHEEFISEQPIEEIENVDLKEQEEFIESESREELLGNQQESFELNKPSVEIEPEDINTEEPVKPEVEEVEPPAAPITLDDLKEDTKHLEVDEGISIQEKISAEDNSIASQLGNSGLVDLNEGITLNDRFLYSATLFDGNMQAFKQAINELNHADSREDAFKIINSELIVRYQWNEKDEVVVNFVKLIERRFV